ncbi:MAG: DUF438 domain-containing protein [Calditrichaeota bacterium]|nr:DUF438 domain-containing protein [Calditrichota bacterium]
MHLSASTRVGELLKEYPFLLDFLVSRSEKFKLLTNPLLRRTVGQVATLAQVASIGGIELATLLAEIAGEIKRQTGQEVTLDTSVVPQVTVTDPAQRIEMLKAIIADLHEGRDVATARQRFRELIKDVEPSEIAAMEQKLIAEGMPEAEVRRLCDVHVEVFKEALERHELPGAPPGHPVHTFMQENRAIEGLLQQVRELTAQPTLPPEALARLAAVVGELRKVDLHYLRKENQLFPLLERHDVSGPSQVMWAIHDDIRAQLKRCAQLLEGGNTAEAIAVLAHASQEIADMVYKEEHILFPLALELLAPEEWARVKSGEEEIGFAWIAPPPPWEPKAEEPPPVAAPAQAWNFDTGHLTPEQANLILTHLPIDLSFVNERDEVVYYSATRERIFPRSPGVIGRKVQKCHPPKSVHIVQQILDDFRSGKKDVAEFWITAHGRFIHIRYFAVRDRAGVYRGCLDETQDVPGIRALTGEKRLLDW